MKVAVLGAGGVGGYFGGRLAEAGVDVSLIARGDHLAALQDRGLQVESVHGDFEVALPATDDPNEIGPCDYVLFCVKAYDTEGAARTLGPMVDGDTAVISLQNGVDNERLIAREVGREAVMGGVAYIFSTIAAPGVIEHTGGPTSFVFGELDGSRSDRAERFLEACDRADGMDATLSTAIRESIWEKAAFICALAGMTAAVRLPLGEIRRDPEAWGMFRRVIEEVWSVARAEGIDLSDDAVDRGMDLAAGLEADAYSSLHYDLTNGNPMELEALHGAVIQRADEHGVAVPMTRAIYGILKPWAERNAADPAREPNR